MIFNSLLFINIFFCILKRNEIAKRPKITPLLEMKIRGVLKFLPQKEQIRIFQGIKFSDFALSPFPKNNSPIFGRFDDLSKLTISLHLSIHRCWGKQKPDEWHKIYGQPKIKVEQNRIIINDFGRKFFQIIFPLSQCFKT